MDKICMAMERLGDCLARTPALRVVYAEAGMGSEPRTRRRPLVELLFQESGRMRMEVGDRRAEMEGGTLALINAYFGNRGVARSAGARYACVSFQVARSAGLWGLTRSPLLLTGKVRNVARVMEAYREVCRIRHAPPRRLPGVWLKAAALRLVAVLEEELAAGSRRESTRGAIVETALRVLADRQSDPALSLSVLARAVRCSPSHLGRVFRREMGLAPMEHLARQRVRRAQHLLQHTRMGVKEIAFHVGVRDPLYFSRLFRKHCGSSPRAYRESGVTDAP